MEAELAVFPVAAIDVTAGTVIAALIPLARKCCAAGLFMHPVCKSQGHASSSPENPDFLEKSQIQVDNTR